MSLLDMLQSKDPAVAQGLLQAGLSLLQSKGSLGPAIGRAGQAGLFGATAYENQRALLDQRKLQEQLLQQQIQQNQRQADMQSLPGKFMKPPSLPGVDATGGMETAQESPANAASPGGFDMQGYLQALMGQDPVQSLQLQAALKQKAPTTVATSPGQIGRDPITGEIRWQNPDKPEKPAAPPTAIQEYQFSQQQGYKGSFNEWIKEKARAGASSTTVSYGAPMAGVDAQGNPVFFQPSKDGGPPSIVSGVSPPKREQPAALQEKLAANAVTLQKIDKALELVQRDGKSLGAQNYLGDPIMQRLDPKGVEVRAIVADIGGQKIHDRSGGAVTVGEAERLKPYIPAATDSPETATTKLKLFRAEYAAMQQAIQSGASVKQAASKEPATQTATNPTTGEKLRLVNGQWEPVK